MTARLTLHNIVRLARVDVTIDSAAPFTVTRITATARDGAQFVFEVFSDDRLPILEEPSA